MGWTATLVTLLISAAVGFWARQGATRPAEPGRVRYVPYTMILFACTLTVTVMVGQILRLAVSP